MSLTLEEIGTQHIDRVQELAAHPQVLATTDMPEPYPADGARQFIEETIELKKKGNRHVYVIKLDDQLIGVCGLENVDQGCGELGYWIGIDYWGKGYASLAVDQLIGLGFGQLGLQTITSHCLLSTSNIYDVVVRRGDSYCTY